MKYLFECKKCEQQEEKEIQMADYDKEKNKQKCSKCGGEMYRIVQNFLGASLCSGMYGIDSGKGWNS